MCLAWVDALPRSQMVRLLGAPAPSAGEYVALSKVENAMKLSQYVEQCMVYALPSESCCVALVVPAEKAWPLKPT